MWWVRVAKSDLALVGGWQLVPGKRGLLHRLRGRWRVMVEVLGTLWDTLWFGDLPGHLIVLGEVLRSVWTGGTRETWEVVDAG